MNIELIVVGKTDMKEVEALVQMYTKRINHYVKFAITTLADVRNTKKLSEAEQKRLEGDSTTPTTSCSLTSGVPSSALLSLPTSCSAVCLPAPNALSLLSVALMASPMRSISVPMLCYLSRR